MATVEFAILLPVMLLLICGTIEWGYQYFVKIQLEGAVIEAARAATASLETDETKRDEVMRASVADAMAHFATIEGKAIFIDTKVYRDFASSYPENFQDTNHNGSYDKGEPFTDRNDNGEWDDATPIEGKLGGPGDVVSYTAHFPSRFLFGFLSKSLGIDLDATTVVRNEDVVRKKVTTA